MSNKNYNANKKNDIGSKILNVNELIQAMCLSCVQQIPTENKT